MQVPNQPPPPEHALSGSKLEAGACVTSKHTTIYHILTNKTGASLLGSLSAWMSLQADLYVAITEGPYRCPS